MDQNKPLEENRPSFGAPVTEGGVYYCQVWVDDGIHPRKLANHHRSGPKLMIVSPSIFTNLTLLDYFLILFPMEYGKGTMLPGINLRLPVGYHHVS